ncbi:MmcQ/YjbR family DNA-binding protein [Bacillus tianshenii]|nr:MmcQ/YjbR family DNA-binding protein [Bacillus tianshenii]
MDKQMIHNYCMHLKGTTHDYQEEWKADRFFVGGKMYVLMGGDSQGKPILTVKCDPDRAEELRETYEGIVPGYYMNKKHWNSIYFGSDVPYELVEKLIAHSYTLVFQGLPKKMQREIV